MQPQFRLGMMMATIAIIGLILVGVATYRRITRTPSEIIEHIKNHPNDPKPELVGSLISMPLVLLLFALPIVLFALAAVAWRWKSNQ